MSNPRGVAKVEHVYKVLFIGDLATGKTCLARRYAHNSFDSNYKATIGVDFALKLIDWDARNKIRLQLWDLAGQERFSSMSRVYYKDAVGCFVVYDITRRATLEGALNWKKDLDSKVILNDGSKLPCILIANKCDLIDKSSEETGEEDWPTFLKETGFIARFETSAKDGTNIDKAIKFLVSKIIEKDESFLNEGDSIKRKEKKDSEDGKITITKVDPSEMEVKKSKCC